MKFKELLKKQKIDVVLKYSDMEKISKADYDKYLDFEAKIEIEKIFTLSKGYVDKVWCIIDDVIPEKIIINESKVKECIKKRKVAACSQCCRYNECPDARR